MRVSRTDCLSNVFLHPKQNLSSVKLLYNFIDKNTGASYKNLMKQKLLFVCTGNICRSPTADGVFRHMVQQANLADLYVGDSAGTHGVPSRLVPSAVTVFLICGRASWCPMTLKSLIMCWPWIKDICDRCSA